MTRIVLITSCWASPIGSFKRGEEIDVDDRLAESLVATKQAKYVKPAEEAEVIEEEKPETGEWTSEPPAKPKREFRKAQQFRSGQREQ